MITAHHSLSFFVLSLALLAHAEVVSVNVDEWGLTGTGTTSDGWRISGITYYKEEGGATFDAVADYALSPDYRGSVTQLVVRVCSTQPTLLRNLTVIPEQADSSTRTWTMGCTPEQKFVEQSFVWSISDEVRQFRFKIVGEKTGNWHVHSLDVYVDRVEAPQDLREVEIYSDALSVAWTSDSRAVSNEVEFDGITSVLPEFNQLERWDFSVFTNATGSSLEFEDSFGVEMLTGVSGEYLNVQPHSGGYLQAGNTKGAGKIRIALTSMGRRTALMRLYRSDAAGTDGKIAVSSVDIGGVTNVLIEPFLTTQPHEFAAELSEYSYELLIETSVKSRRIRVKDVKIVTDYVPGYVITNEITHCRTVRNGRTIKDLQPGDFIWRVRSFDRQGVFSAWTPYRAVTLSVNDPKRHVYGLAVIIR